MVSYIFFVFLYHHFFAPLSAVFKKVAFLLCSLGSKNLMQRRTWTIQLFCYKRTHLGWNQLKKRLGKKNSRLSLKFLCYTWWRTEESKSGTSGSSDPLWARSTLMRAASLHLGRLERRRRLLLCRSNSCIIPSQSTSFFCCRETGIIDVCSLKYQKGRCKNTAMPASFYVITH